MKIINRIRQYFALRTTYPVIRKVILEDLTYLEISALTDIYESVDELEKAGTEGMLIECGCAMGGSAIVMATAKTKERPFRIYDVFGQIPPPTDKDGEDVLNRYNEITDGQAKGLGGKPYYGYENDLIEKVSLNFEKHGLQTEPNNIYLIKGLFEETLNPGGPVALAHIDGDWYESVMVCLQRIEPHLVVGGTMIIDDYDHWSGCRRAVDDFFSNSKKDQFEFVRKNRLHIVRTK